MSRHDLLSEWNDGVNKLAKEFESRLVDLGEFVGALNGLTATPSPIVGLRITIEQKGATFDTEKIGTCSGDPALSTPEKLRGPSGAEATLKIEAWPAQGVSLVPSDLGALTNLLLQVWMPDQRAERHGNLNLKSPVVQGRLTQALEHFNSAKSELRGVFVVYIDLDGFKAINSQESEAEGDKVIAHVATCGMALAKKHSVILTNDGGDEFVIFVRNDGLDPLFEFLWQLRMAVQAHAFGASDRRVDFSAGVALLEAPFTDEAIKAARLKAEQAVKHTDAAGTKTKKRGTVSISWQQEPEGAEQDHLLFGKFIVTLIRSRADTNQPFANSALNLISARCHDAWTKSRAVADVNAELSRAMQWLNLETDEKLKDGEFLADKHWNPKVSRLGIAAAVAHGLLRAAVDPDTRPSKITLQVSSSELEAAVLMEGKLVWGEVPQQPVDLDCGAPVQRAIDVTTPRAFASTIALFIGITNRPEFSGQRRIPDDVFIDSVVVDDRPYTGGGLPDFWQAALAHLLTAIHNAPAARRLMVFGNESLASETVARIKGTTALDVDTLSAITGLSREKVELAAQRLKESGFVVFCDSVTLAVDVLHAAAIEHDRVVSSSVFPPVVSSPGLHRLLDDSPFLLSNLDGVRCATAAEAYPVVLDVLRNCKSDEFTYDDASQKLQEMIGFKIALTSPTKSAVPDFWMKDKDRMQRYANEVLVSPEGIIGKYLRADAQFDTFVKHLSKYCAVRSKETSTRRAILVVPNQVQDGVPRPMGLVSVWATPRTVGRWRKLNFCFVWRTVEAFVGLPYSLYGSVQLATHIAEEIKKNLPHPDRDRLEIGQLTYLALSLHMRVDEFHRRIAKQVVDAASD